MRMMLLVWLLSASSVCVAQEIKPGPLLPQNPPEEQAPANQLSSMTITVPEGTHVQVALANPIHTRDARVGDTVRAVTTFPVTVGKDLAIPQGAFLEGAIVRIGKRGSTRFDGLEIQFKQLVFANGYNVALDISVMEAMAIEPGRTPSGAAWDPAASGLMANGFQQQQQPPPPPPLPQIGPSKALVIGVGTAAMVGVIATIAILTHRHHHDEARDFDTGFQFEIVLQSPLTLDAARVAAAVGAASAQ